MAEKRSSSSSAATLAPPKKQRKFKLTALLENELKDTASSLVAAAVQIILDEHPVEDPSELLLREDYISSDPKLAGLMDDLDEFLSGEIQAKLYAKCEAIGIALEEKLRKDKHL
jgi:NADPH-dependent curcumin reductase CurA